MRMQPLASAPLTRVALALLAAFVAGCSSPVGKNERRQAPADAHGATLALPTVADAKPKDLPGLHNIVAYADGVWTGAVPEGDEGFATLEALGIHTVVSVDGAVPDVDSAKRHGITYVHLPISYDTVPELRAMQLAQVIANTNGPVYMHCHHGKHRSAAAVGAAAVLAGKTQPEAAVERMKVSGTAPAYEGLWSAVRNARPAEAAALKADLATFPAVAKVSGMVAAMAEIDLVNDLVKTSKESNWQPPAFHPDLVAQKETRRLRDLFASLKDDAESKAMDAGYQKLLQRSIDEATQLDEAVRSGDAAKANAMFDALGKSCKECHKPYRDK
jgi:cytochrome c556